MAADKPLSERIAALQQRNTPPPSTPRKSADLPTRPGGQGLKDRIARFEAAGGLPVPKAGATFGLAAPVTSDRKVSGGLIGNRIPSASRYYAERSRSASPTAKTDQVVTSSRYPYPPELPKDPKVDFHDVPTPERPTHSDHHSGHLEPLLLGPPIVLEDEKGMGHIPGPSENDPSNSNTDLPVILLSPLGDTERLLGVTNAKLLKSDHIEPPQEPASTTEDNSGAPSPRLSEGLMAAPLAEGLTSAPNGNLIQGEPASTAVKSEGVSECQIDSPLRLDMTGDHALTLASHSGTSNTAQEVDGAASEVESEGSTVPATRISNLPNGKLERPCDHSPSCNVVSVPSLDSEQPRLQVRSTIATSSIPFNTNLEFDEAQPPPSLSHSRESGMSERPLERTTSLVEAMVAPCGEKRARASSGRTESSAPSHVQRSSSVPSRRVTQSMSGPKARPSLNVPSLPSLFGDDDDDINYVGGWAKVITTTRH